MRRYVLIQKQSAYGAPCYNTVLRAPNGPIPMFEHFEDAIDILRTRFSRVRNMRIVEMDISYDERGVAFEMMQAWNKHGNADVKFLDDAPCTSPIISFCR